jgi:hypothetical protein
MLGLGQVAFQLAHSRLENSSPVVEERNLLADEAAEEIFGEDQQRHRICR